MPHDKNGRELKVGDKVIIEAIVNELQKGEEHCNVNLESVEPMYPTRYKTLIVLNTRQVERVDNP